MARSKQPRVKHVPQRTCVGCREILAKKELVRVVRTPQGIMVDPVGKMAGRGAYIHNQPECWKKAMKGTLAAALKTEITKEDLQQLEEYAANLTEKNNSLMSADNRS